MGGGGSPSDLEASILSIGAGPPCRRIPADALPPSEQAEAYVDAHATVSLLRCITGRPEAVERCVHFLLMRTRMADASGVEVGVHEAAGRAPPGTPKAEEAQRIIRQAPREPLQKPVLPVSGPLGSATA